MNTPSQDHCIVVVEDNSAMRTGMVESLHREGFTVKGFDNGVDALAYLDRCRGGVPLVIADLKMEPVDGLEILRRVKSASPRTEVLMVSAFGTVEAAVESMKSGAADFLTKPFSSEELRIRVRRIFEKIEREEALANLAEQNRMLQDDLAMQYDEMVGSSSAMRRIFELIEQVAGEDTTILIEGESGTGKELVARAIHRKSLRAAHPFVRVNCGALNDNLLESELFGHEKGAFTGAIRQRKGRFELADGGSLFLDEVGDISGSMQVKLLRVLQEKEFERVGGEETLSTDVRVIAATHRDLSKLVMEQRFRDDLYYRLRIIPIKLPSLRERKEDIPALVEHFLRKLAVRRDMSPKTISSEGLDLLQQYTWPGNIRELENLMERLHVISPGPAISTQLIARHLAEPSRPTVLSSDHLPLEDAVSAFERTLILEALKAADGVKNQAARALGIKTSTLYSKMERLGLL
jgi:DNA-binding NtrC family response regulator